MMKKLTIMAVALAMCCATTFANDIKVLLVKTTDRFVNRLMHSVANQVKRTFFKLLIMRII